MKKYALFAFYANYPTGGFNDFVNSSDSFDSLFCEFRKSNFEFGQIVDMNTFEITYLERE